MGREGYWVFDDVADEDEYDEFDELLAKGVGERSNFKKIRTHRIMVMHSNQRGECVHVPS